MRLGPAVLVLLLVSLAWSAQAQAVVFVVNSTAPDADAGINGDCDTDPTADDDCTLRAAIEEANATVAADVVVLTNTNSGADPDDVAFVADQAPAVVSITGVIPTITHALTIAPQASNCAPNPFVSAAPCARVPTGWVIDSDGEVSINGLVFNGGGTAIDVQHVDGTVANAPDFFLTNTWFGVDMSGAKTTPPNTDVLLQDVDGAQIGQESFGENLFARQGTAIDILGADNTSVANNRFGVMPDGSFAREAEGASNNGDNIEVTGNSDPNPDDPATGTRIGNPACSCNLINAAGRSATNIPQSRAGIDLEGDGGNEIPAEGAQIRGNLIGVGSGLDMDNSVAIDVGGADDVEIGGPAVADRNTFGSNGVSSGPGATGLLVQNNVMGADQSQATLSLQGSGQVLDNNLVSGAPSAAIELLNTSSPNFVLQGNVIGETPAGAAAGTGLAGISLLSTASGNTIGGVNPGDGNLISDLTFANNPNTINTTGIRIAGDDNDVIGNRIGVGSDGSARRLLAGVVLVTDADGNTIGGPTAASENLISNTDNGASSSIATAIRITDANSDGNEILRNRGSGNEGPFIDLGGDGVGNLLEPDGPNAGAQAPSISTTAATAASGTAAPNAVVRLFTKADASTGELEGFLAETTADGTGAWQATFASQPAGKLIAATETSGTDTSELSVAVAVPADPDPPPPPPAADTDPPETRIDKAPKDKLKAKKKAKATYSFSSDEAGSTFLCRIDKRPQAPCSSPLKLKKLKKGKHRFEVVAVDAAGNQDASPATDGFKVKRKR